MAEPSQIRPITLELSIDEAALDTFCRRLVSRSRDLAKTQDSLATLDAFVAVFGKASQGTDAYHSIETLIQSFMQQTRGQLLAQRADQLYKALKHCDRSGVASIHTPLSRDGFDQILQAVIARFPEEELNAVTKWAHDWSYDAKRKAESASGYPDALNFSGAGVNILEFQAMLDVSRCLEARE